MISQRAAGYVRLEHIPCSICVRRCQEQAQRLMLLVWRDVPVEVIVLCLASLHIGHGALGTAIGYRVCWMHWRRHALIEYAQRQFPEHLATWEAIMRSGLGEQVVQATFASDEEIEGMCRSLGLVEECS
jgi:hypothetical protein